MPATNKDRSANRLTLVAFAASGFLLVVLTGCGRGSPATAGASANASKLIVGFGLSNGQNPQTGIQSAMRTIALEGLIASGRNGRPQPWLAESWNVSADGLVLRINLHPGVRFHDGTGATAETLREALIQRLPDYMGPAYEDIAAIRAVSEYVIEMDLRRRSTFVVDALDVLIQLPGTLPIGTGPFSVPRLAHDAMVANDDYYSGRPLIDRIEFSPYSSVRAAWADMLRNRVDMLYDVGLEALSSLQPSSETKIFTFRRPYAYMAILNSRRAFFSDKQFRRSLNSAIDRTALVDGVLGGRGAPSEGPVSPLHWAYDPSLPHFSYQPVRVRHRVRFTILYADPSYEPLALALQRQLDEIGVDARLEQAPMDEALERVEAGNFDAFLSDFPQGPNMFRPYLFWYSGAPLNWGQFSSAAVDAALNRVRAAKDDADYRAGVAEFQRAMVDDPPAIFLAWGERARAVSARFEVPVEPGRDILSTLRLWRPIGQARYATGN